MNYIDSSMVNEYIQNEIDYIENEIDFREKLQHQDYYEKELRYLKDLNDSDIKDITQKVNNDSELQDKITELIHYWVYHK